MDQENFAKYLKGKSFNYFGGENEIAHDIEVEIDRDDRYYLVIQHNKDIRTSVIKVDIRKKAS
jgi:hypothetical protein